MQRLWDLFNLRPGEAGLVLVMGSLLVGNSLAQQISGIVAISGFLEVGGANGILVVWVVDVLLIALAAGTQSLVVDLFSRRRLMRMVIGVFAASFIVLRVLFTLPIPEQLNYALLYLVSEQQWLFFPIVFWVLANDTFSLSQAKRLFPLIGGLGLVGKLAGISIAAAAPALLVSWTIPLEDLLLLNVLVYVLIYMVLVAGVRRPSLRPLRSQKKDVGTVLSEGFAFVREVPAFWYLGIGIVAAIVADTIIEFHFLTVSNQIFNTQTSYQTFYSFYQLVLTLSSLVVQAFLTSRIIGQWGLKNVFFVWPVTALASGLWMLALPGLISSVGGVLLQKLPQYTLDESARKSVRALVPAERRGRVSIFMDSYLFAVGTIVACLLTGAILLAGGSYYVYLGLAVAASLTAIWAIARMRQVYDKSLWNWRLERRQHRGSVLDKLNDL